MVAHPDQESTMTPQKHARVYTRRLCAAVDVQVEPAQVRGSPGSGASSGGLDIGAGEVRRPLQGVLRGRDAKVGAGLAVAERRLSLVARIQSSVRYSVDILELLCCSVGS